jgi:hypothetical protein
MKPRKIVSEIAVQFFYGYTICTGAPEISTENGRVSIMAQNSENCLYKHGSGNASVMN